MRRTGVLLAAAFSAACLSPPASAAISVPSEVKECVVFLYGEEANGTFGAGPGFLVGIDHPKLKGRVLTYLVTAKHCLQHERSGPFYPRVFVRLTLRTGDSE